MNYTCPYCGRDTTITDPNRDSFWYKINVKKSNFGEVGFGMSAVTCPNKECQQLILSARLTGAFYQMGKWNQDTDIQMWRLLPESEAKVLPEYIPKGVADDYYESCRIRDLSPKASATLARRCLQGMIRDFWKVVKPTLNQEIGELEDKVDPTTWEAIDSVRSVGNIGAHMEKDINLIIEVESDEAQLLIGLIEQLVDDWYTQKHDREERMKKVKQLAESKKLQRVT